MQTPHALRCLARLSAALVALPGAACTTAQQAEDAEIRRQAAAEIERVCKLQGAEREAALEQIEKESGFVVLCGDKE